MVLGQASLKSFNLLLPPSVRMRGQRIFEAFSKGKGEELKLLQCDEEGVSATYTGTDPKPYRLSLKLDRTHARAKVIPSCSCPFFKSYGKASGCKHLYGLALVVSDVEKKENGEASAENAELVIDGLEEAVDSQELRLLFLLHLEPETVQEGFCLTPVLERKGRSGKITWVADEFLRKFSWSLEEQIWVDRILFHQSWKKESSFPHETSFRVPDYWRSGVFNDLLDQQRIGFVSSTEDLSEWKAVKNGLHQDVALTVTGVEVDTGVQVSVRLRIQEKEVEVPSDLPRVEGGMFLLGDTLYQLSDPRQTELLESRSALESKPMPEQVAREFLLDLLDLDLSDLVDFPSSYDIPTVQGELTPTLLVGLEGEYRRQPTAGVAWRYGDHLIPFGWKDNLVLDKEAFCWWERDIDAELEALSVIQEEEQVEFLSELSEAYAYKPHVISIRKKVMFPFMHRLLERGWEVEIDGQKLMSPTSTRFDLKAASGIDWFDVQASVEFGDQKIELPTLLKALRKGESVVSLDDGSMGHLPESLVQSLRLLTRFGQKIEKNGALRFQGAQSILLDHFLEQLPGIAWSKERKRLRENVQNIQAPEPRSAPRGFRGTLRPYQQEGLGWLLYLQQVGIQGCLADDMGLGKTVQVLALMEQRRQAKAGPSLLVMPKSLVQNWLHEAEQFTPRLKVTALVGSDRPTSLEELPDAHVYVSTYPLVQRDIPWLKEKQFDYAVLDESQAIKNIRTKTAKACRLLRAEHRLTLTGTPVENSLNDVWSQFEFLNPGLLQGVAGAKKALTPQELSILGGAIRPFLLRRTKEQVVKDLPEKVEETLYCEMPPAQRAAYDELKDYYQAQLTATVKEKGLSQSKIMVLEALLRLRQAACHPGLLDPKQQTASCGKLEMLQDMLSDILPTGHKALIFSQFTSFLELVKHQLDPMGIGYAYLDGQTRDRTEQIDRFQTQDDCSLFLISLKAGGVGLNLTAADYVFLLDPWWNPAVEAQAIDRAHRIGQQRNVFAYRMVSENTIEEKILQLQADKKQLADAILSEETSLLSGLSLEELNFLLG